MTEIKHTPTPWNLCYHLRSPEHDASCKCGYRGSIWSADGEYIVLEMGSSPDMDGRGKIQGHTMPQASRPVQLADAALIVEAVNSHAPLIAERDRLREALKPFASVAKHDISMDEDSQDMFRPMLTYNRAPRLSVGHFREAFNALGDDDAL